MSRQRLAPFAIGVLVGLLVLAGCRPSTDRPSAPAGASATSQGDPSAATPAAGRPGGTLTMALRKEINVMNPLVATDSIDYWVRKLMFEPLLNMDTQGHIHPGLAESWETSADGRQYTFKLRQGVRFHNGQEMTADDAKFAIDYTLNPANGAYGFSRLALVDRAEAPDRYTLTIWLKQPSPAFLTFVTEIRAFSVIPAGSIPDGVAKLTDFPPGTGPFKFVEWQPKQRMVFVRNDDYWAHKAFLDRVELRPVTEDTVRITALRANDVHMIESTPYEWVREILDGKVSGVRVAEAPYGGHERMKFNVTDPPFNSKALRQAVAHAVDRAEMLEAAFFGLGKATDQRYPKGHSWYFEGVPSPAFDLERARALVRSSGYHGQPIEILVDKSSMNEAQILALQSQLKRVGIEVTLLSLEPVGKKARISTGDYAMQTGGGSLFADPGSAYGAELLCGDRTKRTANESGYCDPEVDALLRRAEAELDPGRRREFFRQVVTKALDDVPELYVGWVPRFYAFRDFVKGFESGGDGSFLWYGGGLNYTWLDR
jgi:ABC-type transport system substrate-binding protein